MTQTKKAPGGGATFLRFAWQQLRNRKKLRQGFAGLKEFSSIARSLGDLPHGAPQMTNLTVLASDAGWRTTGTSLRKGQKFTLYADGTVWISKPMSVGATPKTALWLRLAGSRPLHKMSANVSTFEAWADGELELCLKPPGEWASEDGALDVSVPRAGATGAIDIVMAVWPGEPATALEQLQAMDNRVAPSGWSYLWRLGDGSIYEAAQDAGKPCIHVHTHGDVGILQFPIEAPVDDSTTLDWRWLVERLPSALPEHIQPTHDYLSMAVEFDNGQDLTYFWSAELPVDTVFKCPLPWWDKRETHWVVRSGRKELGQWQSEHRNLKADYAQAIGGTLPSKIVRVWLIANSVFQRGHGEAKFADIVLSASGAAQRIV